MNNKELTELVRKTDLEPNEEAEVIVDAFIEAALLCNPANNFILELVANRDRYYTDAKEKGGSNF